jgi:hypothetical protein
MLAWNSGLLLSSPRTWACLALHRLGLWPHLELLSCCRLCLCAEVLNLGLCACVAPPCSALGAPNRVNPMYYQKAKEKMKGRLAHLSKDDVGVRGRALEHIWGLNDEENLHELSVEDADSGLISDPERLQLVFRSKSQSA